MGKEKTKKTSSVKDKKDTSALLASKIKNFEVLKKEYELFDELLTINIILHKLSETLEFYLKTIEQILQPEEFHSLYESGAFDDSQKSDLLELYKRIIIVHREILKAGLLDDEKNSISTIQLVHSEITKFKPLMLEIVNRMQDSWKSDPKAVKRESARYFG
jgi:hypothetical protein